MTHGGLPGRIIAPPRAGHCAPLGKKSRYFDGVTGVCCEYHACQRPPA
jgi:hypothetical protein